MGDQSILHGREENPVIQAFCLTDRATDDAGGDNSGEVIKSYSICHRNSIFVYDR
jgi:hypothetical protein